MKIQPKLKTTPRKKTSKKTGSSKKAISIISVKFFWLQKLKLIKHKHTGKLVHHKHTSHLSLMIILIILGFFLVVSNTIVQADIKSGSVSIGMIVPGPAPTVGAIIIDPIDGLVLIDKNIVEVSGTCAMDTFVVVNNNESIIGSTNCTEAGIFILQAQLQTGKNILTALNYDNLNQAGPITGSITVEIRQTVEEKEEVVAPVLPSNPSIITGLTINNPVGIDSNQNVAVGPVVTNCSNYQVGDVAVGGEPHVSIVCVPRLFLPKIEQVIGILVWGGTPPYAVNISWGDEYNNTLVSLSNAGYVTEKFTYASAGSYKIALELKDKDHKKAIVQTAVQVSGEVIDAEESTAISSIVDSMSSLSPLGMSVPFYLLAVAITLGFWCGDIFERSFGNLNSKHQKRA